MSEWNHNVCERDWFLSEDGVLPNGMFRVPVRVKDENDNTADVCCVCGSPTISGIYIRRDPGDPSLLCRGDHDRPVHEWSPYLTIPAEDPA